MQARSLQNAQFPTHKISAFVSSDDASVLLKSGEASDGEIGFFSFPSEREEDLAVHQSLQPDIQTGESLF